MKKILWNIAGGISFILGMIGIPFPIMPTVPLVILSAYCFARGSERAYQYLINHRIFGEIIRNWNEKKVVPRKAKYYALASMSLSVLVMLFIRWPIGLLLACGAIVMLTWLWRFPEQ